MMCLGWRISIEPRATDSGEGCGGDAAGWRLAVASRVWLAWLPPASATFSAPHCNLGGGDFRPRLQPLR
jgi:hypothetical protein